MTSFISTHCCNWSVGVSEHVCSSRGRFHKPPRLRCCGPYFHLGGFSFSQGQGQYFAATSSQSRGRCGPIFSRAVDDGGADSGDAEDGNGQKESSQSENQGTNSDILRENLERIVGTDDSTFSGLDLATLIRNKYGRSYDVQLIKKEFMGRNLLALNVMWKYMEQRSFPLTEEEYLLRLDDVANTLKCWGAVSHIRNSLAKLKERPRIGKAVSIFIDMDETGGRANEWIYK
ncbi:Protease precursor [Gossypium australe]|uniref:Protease n=1 Tax=Gossypium australe TaxID=47621 RepID=A0A5B6VAZ9_9ROSI|nr:Protease precursor [Gossypium australe]